MRLLSCYPATVEHASDCPSDCGCTAPYYTPHSSSQRAKICPAVVGHASACPSGCETKPLSCRDTVPWGSRSRLQPAFQPAPDASTKFGCGLPLCGAMVYCYLGMEAWDDSFAAVE